MSFNTFVTTALILLTNLTPLYFTVQHEWSFLQVYVFYLIEIIVVLVFNLRKKFLINTSNSWGTLFFQFILLYSLILGFVVYFLVVNGDLYNLVINNQMVFFGYLLMSITTQYLQYKINFLGKREYLSTSIERIAFASLGRILVFVLLGVAITVWQDLVMLIVLKTFFETLSYLRTRTDSWDRRRADWI